MGRVSSLIGLTVLFGSVMTGNAFSDPGQDQGGDQGGGSEKITICHATGSATNPYEEITISVNGLNGHEGHEGDIVPAPAGGCPVPQTVVNPITICHATGSETNPYEVLTFQNGVPEGHEGHEGDIVPAPAGGCPMPIVTTTTTPTTTVVTTTPTTTVVTTTPTTTVVTTPPTTVGTGSATESTVSTASVLGVTIERQPAVAERANRPSSRVLGRSINRSGDTLPRTGSGLTGLATFGLGLLAIGLALKLGGRPTPATVRVQSGR